MARRSLTRTFPTQPSAPVQNIPADKLRVTVITPQGNTDAGVLKEGDIKKNNAMRFLDISSIAAMVIAAHQ